MTTIDPGAQQILDLGAKSTAPPMEAGSPAEARRAYRESYLALQGDKVAVAKVEDITVPTRAGSVTARLYVGAGAPSKDAPLLLYCHGGGWVIGDLDSHDEICRLFADLAGAVVLCPDYRLAPEHKYPAGLEDCCDTLIWAASHAETLGIDPANMAVAGDSAGGNLASILALLSAQGSLPALAAQLLIYPNTDARQTADSYRRFAEGYGLTAQTMRWFRDHYIRSAADTNDWRMSPLLAESLAGAPPAFVAIAELDILADEGSAYIDRLKADGVRLIEKRWSDQIHGFASMGRYISEARVVVADAVKAWKEFAG